MARTDTAVKRKLEAEYERRERSTDTGTDHVGQMTIAFCATDWCSYDPSSCPG